MELFELGIQNVFQPSCLILILFGTFFGIIFGAIPGLTATMGVALLIPFTFNMPSIEGIALLIGVFIGGISGGLISASLLGMPGTPSSVATTFDAYPMVKKGQAGQALGIGIFSSFFAGITTAFGLALLAPQIAKIALKFGYFEYFSLGIFALTIVVTLSKGGMIKGLLAGSFGLMFSFFGAAPIDMTSRFTFGFKSMKGGFSLLPVLIGLFAISQIMKDITESSKVLVPKIDTKNIFPPLSLFKQDWKNLIRSTFIGFFIGILPGIGGATANVVAYGQAKYSSNHPEKFGTGYAPGIIASESANNATTGGALIPLITMGIPGDSVTAILLGGLMIHGLHPGPMLFKYNPDVVYSIFISVFVANIFMLIIMILGIRFFILVLKTPKKYLLPIILILCVVGSFALNNRIFDVWSLFIFGFIGFLLEKLKFPLTPVILGIILGPIIEINIRQGLMASNGSLLPIFTRPISLVFIILSVFSIILPNILEKKNKKVI